MKYLKKRKMYELAANRLGYADDMPLLKNCTYSFHRGSEYLEFVLKSGNCVRFSFLGYFVVREMLDYFGGQEIRVEVFFKNELLPDDING